MSKHEESAKRVRFRLGMLVATPGVLEEVPNTEIANALLRHASGDWGACDPHDAKENDRALVLGLRIFSVYHSKANVKFWVITESDRSATTVLLPTEY